MIIDVHSHTPVFRDVVPEEHRQVNAAWRPDAARPTAVTWAEYLEAMSAVDRAICFNIALSPGDNPNDPTAAFVRAHPGRLIGFVSVHADDPGAIGEIERGVGDLGLRGIKLGPNYQRFDPCGERAFVLYAYAQAHRLPVLFHQGTSPVQFAPLEYSYPLHMDRIAMAFPQLKIIMAHMGHPWQRDCIVVIRKHPNVYADVSALHYRPYSFYDCMRLATEWGVLPKLLFGSDFPVATPQETMEGLRRVNAIVKRTPLPPVPEDQLEAIIHRDSLTLLGLE